MIAVVLALIVVITGVAIGLTMEGHEDQPDRPLDHIQTPDGTYVYDAVITANGSSVEAPLQYTVKNGTITAYKVGDHSFTSAELKELEDEMAEQRKHSYSYIEGPYWNNGSTECGTYVITYSGYDAKQVVSKDGRILYESSTVDGVNMRITLKDWKEGVLYHEVRFIDDNGIVLKSETVRHNGSVIIYTPAPKANYLFNGWSLPGDNYLHGAGSEYPSVTKDLNFTASWSPVQHEVIFDANGGTGTKSYTIGYGLSVTSPNESTFVREGYTFCGWSTSKSASVPMYQGGQKITVYDDVIYYAVWSNNVAVVTFNGNGGVGTYTWTVEIGTTINLPSLTINSGQTISRTGYDFRGWASNPSVTNPDYTTGNTYKVTKNVTFYAVWKVKEYAVSFDPGDEGYGSFGSIAVKHGSLFNPSYYPVSVKGYAFECWTLNGVKYDNTKPVTSDITLKARWIRAIDCQFSGTTITLQNYLGVPLDVFWGDNTADLGTTSLTHTYNRPNVDTTLIVMAEYNGLEVLAEYKVDIGSWPGFTVGYSSLPGGTNTNSKVDLYYKNTGSDVPITWVLDYFQIGNDTTCHILITLPGLHWYSLVGITDEGISGHVSTACIGYYNQ